MNAASNVSARREAILATLRSILVDDLAVRIPGDALGPDIPLFGLGVGLDSVDGVELALAVEREFGVEIPQDERFPAITRSLNCIADHVLGVERDDGAPPVHATLRCSVALVRNEDLTVVELRAERVEALWEALEHVLPCELVLYDGQARPAILLDERGCVRADVTVASLQGSVLVFAEGVDGPALVDLLAPFSDRVEIRDVSPDVTSIGLHGPYAWELVGAWIGRKVSVLPPLGIMRLPSGVTVLRSGRTGEYGFEVILPRALAPELLAKLAGLGRRFDLAEISPDDLAAAIVETGGFSARALLRKPLSPAELQLDWRLAPKLRRQRASGPSGERRSVLFRAASPSEGPLYLGERVLGEVVFSHRRSDGTAFGLALVETASSHPGLTLTTESGATVTTHSAPLVRPRSLGVRPQVDRFERHP
jgi:glycine cleavage system aminomethyltransferase T/acyl carrier protein